jgi:hypothetical protein
MRTTILRERRGNTSRNEAARCFQDTVGVDGIKAFDYDNDGDLDIMLTDALDYERRRRSRPREAFQATRRPE